jgi:hypothetical protein
MKLRCKLINGRRLCPVTDVARLAGVHRNGLYQQRGRLGIVDLLGLKVMPERSARDYIKTHAPLAARAKRVGGGRR